MLLCQSRHSRKEQVASSPTTQASLLLSLKEEGKCRLTTNTMAFDLLGQFLNHVDLPGSCLALFESFHRLCRPCTTFPTRRALPATLVLVELAQPCNHPDHIGRLVHDNHRRRAQTGLTVFERVKVHELIVTDVLGQDWRR